MMDIIDRVQETIDGYECELSSKGLVISVHKRYFEKTVFYGSCYSLDRAIDDKYELKHGFRFRPNVYECVVLTISPKEKGRIKKELCRDYSYLIEKTARPYFGCKPKTKIYSEDKIIASIKTRIEKILKKAEYRSTEELCKDTVYDVFRYNRVKYGYKKRILNKDRYSLDPIILVAEILFYLLVLLAAIVLAFLLS